MSKTQDMLKNISKNPRFIKKIQNTQSIEELFKFCKEIEEGLRKLIAKTNSNNIVEISDDELEIIAGGRMDFNKFKASAITALMILGGMSATTGLTQVFVHAAPMAATSAEINEKTQEALNAEFSAAVRAKNLEKCEQLLKLGADINATSKYGSGDTVILENIYHLQPEFLKFLISNGVDINKKNKEDKTPLMSASSMLNIPLMKLFLENGADPNLQDNEGKTALVRCILKREENSANVNTDEKSVAAIKLLLKHGADTKAEAVLIILVLVWQR